MASADVIPWWGWVVIWGALGLLLVGVLVAFAVSLVRSGLAVVREVGAAGERFGELSAQVERLPPHPPAAPAVLEDPAVLRRERLERARRARKVRAATTAVRRAQRAATPIRRSVTARPARAGAYDGRP